MGHGAAPPSTLLAIDVGDPFVGGNRRASVMQRRIACRSLLTIAALNVATEPLISPSTAAVLTLWSPRPTGWSCSKCRRTTTTTPGKWRSLRVQCALLAPLARSASTLDHSEWPHTTRSLERPLLGEGKDCLNVRNGGALPSFLPPASQPAGQTFPTAATGPTADGPLLAKKRRKLLFGSRPHFGPSLLIPNGPECCLWLCHCPQTLCGLGSDVREGHHRVPENIL